MVFIPVPVYLNILNFSDLNLLILKSNLLARYLYDVRTFVGILRCTCTNKYIVRYYDFLPRIPRTGISRTASVAISVRTRYLQRLVQILSALYLLG